MTDFIKDLTLKNIPSLKKFIEKQFHKKYVLLKDDFFEWQYKANPYNSYPEYAMKIIESKGEVLGYNGLIPASMKVFDQDLAAVNFANLMIDEKCRGFGLGALLIKESSKDFPVCYTTGYGLDTKVIYEKLGNWTDMGVLRRFIRILDVEKVKKLINKEIVPGSAIADSEDENLRIIDRFGRDIDIFWERIKEKYPITLNRNKEYLNWRYADHPMLKYQIFYYIAQSEIKGYAVLRIEECDDAGNHYKIGRIIDFISEDEYEEAMIRAIVERLQKQGVDFIDFFFSGNFHVRSLLNQGFVENIAELYKDIPMLFSPLDRRRSNIDWIVYFKDYPQDKKECINVNNWYITKGDGDQDRPNILPDA